MPSSLLTRLTARNPIAVGVAELWFDVLDEGPFAFQGGQFVTFAVGLDGDGQPVRRSYSLASAPTDGRRLRLVIKVIPGGTASDFLLALPLGSTLPMTGPHGFFVLEPRHPGDVVWAATGTGLAAIFPMLHELQALPALHKRVVYWGLRTQADIFLLGELQALCAAAGAELHIHLSKPEPGWTGLTGRIGPPLLARVPHFLHPTFYLVGNGAMIAEMKTALVAAGISRRQHIRTEAFFEGPL